MSLPSFQIDQAIEVLARTPATFDSLLRGSSPEWHHANEGPETFSPYDVVGHLIHGERTDWIPRLRIILDHGTSRPFDRYDRFAQARESLGQSMEQLLDSFRDLRRANLTTLEELRPAVTDNLDRRGSHPELGEVTLGQLLSTWVVHDLGHVAQATRVMAKRYGLDVGPWRAYLPVLTR